MTTLYRNIRIVIPALILVWQLPLAAQDVAQNAQNAQNIAAREVARRQAGIAQGKTALEHGQAAAVENGSADFPGRCLCVNRDGNREEGKE
jgi:hypothetical protein